MSFPESYGAARASFLAAAAGAQARIETHVLVDRRGRDGEELAIDVARVGPARDVPALLVISGLHGVEGFAGSVVQTRWLRRIAASAPPRDHGLVLVHAANPYGFSWSTRGDENNVDLNRNLHADYAGLPTNDGYDAIHPILATPAWSPEVLARQDAALAAYAETHGAQALTTALFGGQHRHADGLGFGGRARSWSVGVLVALADAIAATHRGLAILDLHTGVARYGEAVVLPFSDMRNDAARLLLTARGDARFSLGAAGLARMTGIVAAGLAQRAAPSPALAAVLEFGTVDRVAIRRALRIDLALRFRPPSDAGEEARARREVLAAFYPPDPGWRGALLSLADALIEGAGAPGAVVAALA
ncbi:MAG: DUF2817 domain-containing protein [Alphaproteobacteria bacterium]|nr:DUF2817 domain-containing protein [Alphaproteobacteria bacterium]